MKEQRKEDQTYLTTNKSNIKLAAMKIAFVKSLPIMCSYIFLSVAYGILMQQAGFKWYYSLITSMTVYTGAFQYVLITFLSSKASLVTIAVTALLMNSRQVFYSLTFLKQFKKMGKRKLYMIHSLTDETYAVNCTLDDNELKPDIMFYIALFSWCYRMIGSVIGGLLAQIIPYTLKGIDFCMTALFVIIFIDQWEKAKSHKIPLIGIAVAIICLFVFGKNVFMLPALLISSALLLLFGKEKNE